MSLDISSNFQANHSKSIQKIGILGGSFDPIHIAHLQIAHQAFLQMHLDKVLFMPTSLSPFKPAPPHVSDAHRLQMLHLATQNTPHFEVNDLAISRKGISYCIDTVHELLPIYPSTTTSVDPLQNPLGLEECKESRNAKPERTQVRDGLSTRTTPQSSVQRGFVRSLIYWIIGSDLLPTLHLWKNFDELITLIQFIVVVRPDYPYTTSNPQLSLKLHPIQSKPIDISSTQIRKYFKAHDYRAAEDCLPTNVYHYIKEHHLYHA